MAFNQANNKELPPAEAASLSATNYIYEQSHLKGYKAGWVAGWTAAFQSISEDMTESKEEEEGIELELSKEWVEYFSRRDTTKTRRKSKENDDDLEELPDLGGVAERERVMKMKGIYGEEVTKDLCAKEALLSAHFDKHVAILHAQLWPQLPILGAEGPSVNKQD